MEEEGKNKMTKRDSKEMTQNKKIFDQRKEKKRKETKVIAMKKID